MVDADLDTSMRTMRDNLTGMRESQAALENAAGGLRVDLQALAERLEALEPHVGPLIARLRA